MSGAAVAIKKQNRYMQKFKDSGAISKSTARPLKEIGIVEDYIFRAMVKRGVFIKTDNDRYYINCSGSDEFIIKRSRLLIMIFAALVVFAVIYYTLSLN